MLQVELVAAWHNRVAYLEVRPVQGQRSLHVAHWPRLDGSMVQFEQEAKGRKVPWIVTKKYGSGMRNRRATKLTIRVKITRGEAAHRLI